VCPREHYETKPPVTSIPVNRALASARYTSTISRDEENYVSTSPKLPRRIMSVPKRLPPSFVPSNYSVLMGRAQKFTKAFGNTRCRVLAQYFMEQYDTACKPQKNAILCDIVDIVHDACPNGGAFIRQRRSDDDGGFYWEEVDDEMAREKVGTFLRDCLESKYRSSTKSKVKARRERRRLAAGIGRMEEERAVSFNQEIASKYARSLILKERAVLEKKAVMKG
jgi:hypothetical protein